MSGPRPRHDDNLLLIAATAILILTAQNSEIEHQTALDTTVGGPKPLGVRGAVMADTPGPAAPARSKEH